MNFINFLNHFLTTGTLKIIDRKKDLLKLQMGEYISLGKVSSLVNSSLINVINNQVESEFKSCQYVDNICVYGDSFETFIVALVIPNPIAIRTLAKKLGKPENMELKQLYQDPAISQHVLNDMIIHGKRAGLHKSEIPQKIRLCPEEWTPDSGLVTAALKIRRKPIQEFYQIDIDQMYGKTGDQNNNNIFKESQVNNFINGDITKSF